LSKLLLFFEVKYSVCIQLSQHAKDDNEEEEEEEEKENDDGSLLLFLAFPFLLPKPFFFCCCCSFFSFAVKCCQDLVSEQFLLCSFSSSLICMIKKLARVKNNGWMDGCEWMLWMDVNGCCGWMNGWMDVDGCGVWMDE